jgi:hypothetical protein
MRHWVSLRALRSRAERAAAARATARARVPRFFVFDYRVFGNFLRADGVGATYWVSNDGTRVLRGDTIGGADELQPGFLEAMALVSSEAD